MISSDERVDPAGHSVVRDKITTHSTVLEKHLLGMSLTARTMDWIGLDCAAVSKNRACLSLQEKLSWRAPRDLYIADIEILKRRETQFANNTCS